MAYCTQADLNRLISDKELAQLAIDEPEEETLESEVVRQRIATVIAEAQDEIDNALRPFASTPLESPPEELKALTIRGAVVKLRERKTETFRGIDEVRAEQHARDLEALREGKRLFGVRRTKGLPSISGAPPHNTVRPYAPGSEDDPIVANAGKADPLAGY